MILQIFLLLAILTGAFSQNVPRRVVPVRPYTCTPVEIPSDMYKPNGTHFNAIVQVKPPYVMVKPDSVIKGAPGEEYYGISIEIWENLAACWGLTWNYSRLDYNQVAGGDDVVRAVASGQYDIAIAAIGLTKDREQIVEFTQPYEDLSLYVITTSGYTGRGPNLWAFAEPFQPSAWWMTLIALVVGVLALSAINWGRYYLHSMHSVAENRAMRAEVEEGDWWAGVGWIHSMARFCRELLHSFWQFYTVGLQQGDLETVGRSLENYIIWGAWILFTVIVYSAYQGSLTAYLTTSLVKAGSIQGFDSLTVGTTVAVRIGSDAEKYVLRSIPPGVRVTSVHSIDDIVALITNGTVDAGIDDATVINFVSSYDCFVAPVGNAFYPKGNSFLLQNFSPWAEFISMGILDMKEQGYVEGLVYKYLSQDANECADEVAAALANSDGGALTWEAFWGLLIIWGALAAASLLLMIARALYTYIGAKSAIEAYKKALVERQANVENMDKTAFSHVTEAASDNSDATAHSATDPVRRTEYSHSHTPSPAPNLRRRRTNSHRDVPELELRPPSLEGEMTPSPSSPVLGLTMSPTGTMESKLDRTLDAPLDPILEPSPLRTVHPTAAFEHSRQVSGISHLDIVEDKIAGLEAKLQMLIDSLMPNQGVSH